MLDHRTLYPDDQQYVPLAFRLERSNTTKPVFRVLTIFVSYVPKTYVFCGSVIVLKSRQNRYIEFWYEGTLKIE